MILLCKSTLKTTTVAVKKEIKSGVSTVSNADRSESLRLYWQNREIFNRVLKSTLDAVPPWISHSYGVMHSFLFVNKLRSGHRTVNIYSWRNSQKIDLHHIYRLYWLLCRHLCCLHENLMLPVFIVVLENSVDRSSYTWFVYKTNEVVLSTGANH